MSDFDEFAEVVGTKAAEEGWYVFFNQEGFVRAIQAPGENRSFFHHRMIRTYVEGYDFLRAHGRPDLIKSLNKIGIRGNTRERLHSE